MNINEIKATLKQHNNKTSLTLVLELTQEQKDLFLLENGEQPKEMIKIIIKEVL